MEFGAGDVIYNAVYPLAAPDVIFGAEDETFRPYHSVSDASDSKSLKNPLTDWNNRDPTSLFTLVLQLRLGIFTFHIISLYTVIHLKSIHCEVRTFSEKRRAEI